MPSVLRVPSWPISSKGRSLALDRVNHILSVNVCYFLVRYLGTLVDFIDESMSLKKAMYLLEGEPIDD